MERFIYEVRPYFFFILGCGALYFARDFHDSAAKLMLISGVMLLLSTAYVVYERLRYRGIIS